MKEFEYVLEKRSPLSCQQRCWFKFDMLLLQAADANSLGQTQSSPTSQHMFLVSAEDHNFNSSHKTFDGALNGARPSLFTDGSASVLRLDSVDSGETTAQTYTDAPLLNLKMSSQIFCVKGVEDFGRLHLLQLSSVHYYAIASDRLGLIVQS